MNEQYFEKLKSKIKIFSTVITVLALICGICIGRTGYNLVSDSIGYIKNLSNNGADALLIAMLAVNAISLVVFILFIIELSSCASKKKITTKAIVTGSLCALPFVVNLVLAIASKVTFSLLLSSYLVDIIGVIFAAITLVFLFFYVMAIKNYEVDVYEFDVATEQAMKDIKAKEAESEEKVENKVEKAKKSSAKENTKKIEEKPLKCAKTFGKCGHFIKTSYEQKAVLDEICDLISSKTTLKAVKYSKTFGYKVKGQLTPSIIFENRITTLCVIFFSDKNHPVMKFKVNEDSLKVISDEILNRYGIK